MEIHDKKDFYSSVVLSSVWAILSLVFFIFGPFFIGAMFACSALISGYYTLAYYLKTRKEETTQENYEAVETIDIDH